MDVSTVSPSQFKRLSLYQSASLSLVRSTGTAPAADDAAILGLNPAASSPLGSSIEEMIAKINELIAGKLPKLEASNPPADASPEATADKILSGISALMPAFARQNPDLEGADLIEAFVAEAKKGIEMGFGQAFSSLEDMGAFQVEGLKEGIERTKQLLDEGLAKFAEQLLGGRTSKDADEDVDGTEAGETARFSFTYNLRLEAQVAMKSSGEFDVAA